MSKNQWTALRVVSATDDTGPAADGVDWTSMDEDAYVNVKSTSLAGNKLGGIEIIFKGTDAADEVTNWALYAAESGGPAICVAYGTATLGATETGTADTFYADTITVTASGWPGGVSVTTNTQYNMGTGAVAGAGIATMYLDTREYEYFTMKMEKDTAASMGCDYRIFV